MKTVFVVDKKPVSVNYIPKELNGTVNLIREHEVIKRTQKGFRLRVSYAPDNGSMYLDEHYEFFTTYSDALRFIAKECNSLADELQRKKEAAIILLCHAHNELKVSGGAV
ncbi:hypothetical protein ACRPHS_03525 [Pantoea allii]|uniref:hypothetical protein n=1 Tax=Pantoea allii TaxID=574096 RepID=UPI00155F9BE3|nr:hypothetical protein [Pantoea allii]NQS87103.1 hypothetical protein [Pantoea allii]